LLDRLRDRRAQRKVRAAERAKARADSGIARGGALDQLGSGKDGGGGNIPNNN
jgi:hypothetical protein